MNEERISVVIPAYNCAATLGAAIDSALSQEVPVEVIVVDDASREDLTQVLEAYREDGRVIYARSDRPLGAAGARNLGVSLAKGAYIAFLDADDLWVSGKLKQQMQLLQETGAVLCATARELMTPAGECTGKVIPVKEHITYRRLLKHNCINCSSVVIRADVAREFPMHHDDSHEDYIMWLEVLKKYGFACGVNLPLLKYRLSTTGKSGSKLKSAGMTYRVYRYVGFGPVRAALLFCRYAFHGVWKYAIAALGGRHEA